MRRKKLKLPKYAGDKQKKEYASSLKHCSSQRTTLEANLKLPFSAEAYSAVAKLGVEFLKTQHAVDGMTAEIFFDYESEIESLRARNKQLEREKKGLLIELRKSLKIKDGEKKEEENSDKTEPDKKEKQGKRGAPVGHRGKSRSIPENVTHTEVVQPSGKCDCG